MAETLSTRGMQAQAAQQPFLETLGAMLQDELDCRRSSLMQRRFNRFGLDDRTSLADFDWRFNPKLPRVPSLGSLSPVEYRVSLGITA